MINIFSKEQIENTYKIKELLKKDSLYLDLKIKTDLKIKELEKEHISLIKKLTEIPEELKVKKK